MQMLQIIKVSKNKNTFLKNKTISTSSKLYNY